MLNQKRIRWIASTGVLLALLIVLQAATAPLGQTLLTGSLVNLILVLSVLLVGPSSALTIALLSPVAAKLVNIGSKFWEMIPFIILGNLVLVLIWFLITKNPRNYWYSGMIALIAASAVKFAVLFFGVTKICIPLILKLPEPAASTAGAAFSFPQMITALIGGTLALLLAPRLRAALRITPEKERSTRTF